MTHGGGWAAVRDYLYRRPVVPCTQVVAGSPEWVALSDDDPEKLAAVLTAGSRWVLEHEMDQIDQRRREIKSASVAISEALAWSRVAKRIRGRDTHYIERKAS